MSANTFPAQIEPFKWAEQAYAWTGTLPLSRFARVAREAVEPVEQQLVTIDCKLSLDAYYRLVWLDATLSTAVPLQCQRCLEVVTVQLDSQVRLAIIEDEALIDRLDEDADFIILGESEASTKGDFSTPAVLNLLTILEDELLLLMPLSPKHDACEHKHQPAAQAVEIEQKENPFEVLASLKGKLDS